MIYRCLTGEELSRFAYTGDRKAAQELLRRIAKAEIFEQYDVEESYEQGRMDGAEEENKAMKVSLRSLIMEWELPEGVREDLLSSLDSL